MTPSRCIAPAYSRPRVNAASEPEWKSPGPPEPFTPGRRRRDRPSVLIAYSDFSPLIVAETESCWLRGRGMAQSSEFSGQDRAAALTVRRGVVTVSAMARRKTKDAHRVKDVLRQRIGRAVAAAFPGCTADFVGQQSRAALVGRTFGFRVRDRAGNHRSNIVRVNPEHAGAIGADWVRQAVAESNG